MLHSAGRFAFVTCSKGRLHGGQAYLASCYNCRLYPALILFGLELPCTHPHLCMLRTAGCPPPHTHTLL